MAENTIRLTGRIDSNNAAQLEKELLAAAEGMQEITLDAEELEYISSAGLRVLLKLKKQTAGEVTVINASKDVYDIFEVTGFNNILTVKKALRSMSIDGLALIGKGGTGSVYRVDNDTIIKVFNKNVSIDMINRESSKAKKAFLFGVPTAISYDIVKVGECLGVVYELLNAEDLVNVIMKDKEHLEDHIKSFALKMREMNSIEVDDSFEDTKARTIRNMGHLEGILCTADEVRKLRAVIENVPDRNTFIHGDAHIGNVMLQKGEYMFIDLAGASKGHPIFDMVSMCIAFKMGQNANEETRNNTALIKGFTTDEMRRIWDTYLRTYLGSEDEAFLKKAERQILVITCARVIMSVLSVPGLFPPDRLAFFKNTVIDYYDSGIEPLCF